MRERITRAQQLIRETSRSAIEIADGDLLHPFCVSSRDARPKLATKTRQAERLPYNLAATGEVD